MTFQFHLWYKHSTIRHMSIMSNDKIVKILKLIRIYKNKFHKLNFVVYLRLYMRLNLRHKDCEEMHIKSYVMNTSNIAEY